MEISLNIETEVFIELTLSWFSLPLINIDNIPLLVDLITLVLDFNVSVFLISVAVDSQYFTLFISDKCSLVSE
jgi:hypothetical protein